MRGLGLSVFFLISNANAEIATPTSPSQNTSVSLPHCIDSKTEVESIASDVQINKAKPTKYKSYRTVLQSDSDTELLARLAYAETVAANCSDVSPQIAPLIVQVISHRVRQRSGNVRAVVFECNQFASSLNIYGEARYRDFLCPKDAKLWSMVLTAAKRNLETPAHDLDINTVNYFLYKHSPRFKKENWILPEDKSPSTTTLRSCIKFFINRGWKSEPHDEC